MSGNSSTSYDKIRSKRSSWCGMRGFRLNPRRFSVHRLRNNIFRVLRRWKNSYRNCVRRILVRRSTRTKDHKVHDHGQVSSSSTSSFHRVRTMAHSNSFCSEAIADCLEFIKRNSVSIDDDRKPILTQI